MFPCCSASVEETKESITLRVLSDETLITNVCRWSLNKSMVTSRNNKRSRSHLEGHMHD